MVQYIYWCKWGNRARPNWLGDKRCQCKGQVSTSSHIAPFYSLMDRLAQRGKKKAIVVEEDDPEQREPIPKVTWSVTKDKTVRELLEVRHHSQSGFCVDILMYDNLQHHGLPTDGDRKKQERRYDRWIAFHNASLDTEGPRDTLSSIRRKLRAWEKIMNVRDAALIEKKRKEREGDTLDEKKYLVSCSSGLSSASQSPFPWHAELWGVLADPLLIDVFNSKKIRLKSLNSWPRPVPAQKLGRQSLLPKRSISCLRARQIHLVGW